MQTWQVVDAQTGAALKRAYETYRAANRAAERKNQAYGAVRYSVRQLPRPTAEEQQALNQRLRQAAQAANDWADGRGPRPSDWEVR